MKKNLVKINKSFSESYCHEKKEYVKQENKILRFKIITREQNKYIKDYLFTYNEIESLKKYSYVITADICSFCKIHYNQNQNLISFNFSFLELSMANDLQGKSFFVQIDANEFFSFYHGSETEKSFLSVNDKTYKTNIIFTERGNKILKDIKQNKVIRKKFAKSIMRFNSSPDKKIKIYFDHDHVKYSFFWSKTKNNERDMHGGLILHKDYKNPDDLQKAFYSVHT